MNENKNSVAAKLIAKHVAGTITDIEKEELSNWLAASKNNEKLFKTLTGPKYVAGIKEIQSQDVEAKWDSIIKNHVVIKETKRKPWWQALFKKIFNMNT